MKKFIALSLAAIIGFSVAQAQSKNYLSIEAGMSLSGMTKKISDNMRTCGLGSDITWFFILMPITDHYPKISTQSYNYRARFGHHINERTAIEAGGGVSYQATITGAAANGENANYLNIDVKFSTAYAAYMINNKKGNLAIGLGPTVTFCNIKQSSSSGELSNKNYVLPGAIITGNWHFINQKHWFMELRSDLTITAPAKTESVTIINGVDKNFVTYSKSTSFGAAMCSFSMGAGIKF